MKSEDPLLSIVIPTRNREFYCIRAIENILAYKRLDFELVINDNSDSDEIQEYINRNPDTRLCYYHNNVRINSSLNINEALDKAKGKFIIMIGDDDTIMPCIFEVVDYMDINGIEVLSPVFQNSFIWQRGNIGLYNVFPRKSKLRKLNSDIQLTKILKNGIIGYQDFAPPRVYHGIVKKEILDMIKRKVGVYVNGLSPDIYITISLLQIVKTYHICYFPISIQGICSKSTAYAGMTGTHKGSMNEAPHLYQREDYEWDKRIPYIYSVETIWAESALKSITDFNCIKEECVNSLFNKKYFNTVFQLNNPDLAKSNKNKIEDCRINNLYSLKYLIKKYSGKLRSLVLIILRRRRSYIMIGWEEVTAYESKYGHHFPE